MLQIDLSKLSFNADEVKRIEENLLDIAELFAAKTQTQLDDIGLKLIANALGVQLRVHPQAMFATDTAPEMGASLQDLAAFSPEQAAEIMRNPILKALLKRLGVIAFKLLFGI